MRREAGMAGCAALLLIAGMISHGAGAAAGTGAATSAQPTAARAAAGAERPGTEEWLRAAPAAPPRAQERLAAGGQIAVERFVHFGQDSTVYPSGTWRRIYTPTGLAGQWFRWDECVPKTKAEEYTDDQPHLRGCVRGPVYRGAQLWWDDADAALALDQPATFNTALATDLPPGPAYDGWFREFQFHSILFAPTHARVWFYGKKDRGVLLCEFRSGALVLDTRPIDCHLADPGVTCTAWLAVPAQADRIRIRRPEGLAERVTLVGLDYLDVTTTVEPGTSLVLAPLAAQQTALDPLPRMRPGFIMIDGHRGDLPAIEVQDVLAVWGEEFYDTDTKFTSFGLAVYWNDPGGPFGEQYTVGGLSHLGIDGGTQSYATQLDVYEPVPLSQAGQKMYPGHSRLADYYIVTNTGAKAYRERMRYSVRGTYDGRFVWNYHGLRLYDRVEVTTLAGMDVFAVFVLQARIPPDIRHALFWGDPAGAIDLPYAETYSSPYKCHSLVLWGGSNRTVYRMDELYNWSAAPPEQRTWIYGDIASRKAYINYFLNVEDPLLAGPGTTFVADYSIFPIDESIGAFGFPRGDLNCDGHVNAFDIDPFVLALTDPGTYEAAYPQCDRLLADCNGDGSVDAFDIDSFVALLVSA